MPARSETHQQPVTSLRLGAVDTAPAFKGARMKQRAQGLHLALAQAVAWLDSCSASILARTASSAAYSASTTAE